MLLVPSSVNHRLPSDPDAMPKDRLPAGRAYSVKVWAGGKLVGGVTRVDVIVTVADPVRGRGNGTAGIVMVIRFPLTDIVAPWLAGTPQAGVTILESPRDPFVSSVGHVVENAPVTEFHVVVPCSIPSVPLTAGPLDACTYSPLGNAIVSSSKFDEMRPDGELMDVTAQEPTAGLAASERRFNVKIPFPGMFIVKVLPLTVTVAVVPEQIPGTG